MYNRMEIIKARSIVQAQAGCPIQIAKAQCPTPVDSTDLANKTYVDSHSGVWTPSSVNLSFAGAGLNTPVTVTATLYTIGQARDLYVPAFTFVPINNSPIGAQSSIFGPAHDSGSTFVYNDEDIPFYLGFALVTSNSNGNLVLSCANGSWTSKSDNSTTTTEVQQFHCSWIQASS